MRPATLERVDATGAAGRIEVRVNDPGAHRRGVAIESMVSGGCIVSGAVFRSVLFSQVRVHSHASVNWSVLLPGVVVGRRARLTRVVVDRGTVIPDDMVIGEDAEADARHFHRTESGITLVTREMLVALEGHEPVVHD